MLLTIEDKSDFKPSFTVIPNIVNTALTFSKAFFILLVNETCSFILLKNNSL